MLNLASWTEEARCAGMDLDLFFSENPKKIESAKKTCVECPVRNQCLYEHIHDEYGVFGGMGRRERRKLAVKKGLRQSAPPVKPRQAYSDEDRENAIKLYTTGNMGLRRVAAETAIPESTVDHWLKQAGVKRTKAQQHALTLARQQEEARKRQEIRELSDQGLDAKEVAERTGSHVSHVYRVRRQDVADRNGG